MVPNSLFLVGLLFLICSINALTQQEYARAKCDVKLAHAATPTGYCAFTWASGLGQPRGITVADNGDVLIVDQRGARVLALWEDASGRVQNVVLATTNGLNHAVQVHDRYLYASNPTTVYRWPYTAGTRRNLGTPEVVVRNVPCCHHTTRALAFDREGLLYVQSGSGSNVDPDSTHSQIRRFKVAVNQDWATGELFADGMRNEVGIRFDAQGVLWGVENGCDDLNRPDLGGDIHQDNPSEEVNAFRKPGLFYGYPYCWSEYKFPLNKSHPVGTQWAHPDFLNDGRHTDAWCQNPNNVVPPVYNLPAHTAPLDIIFYNGTTFPSLRGHAFVTEHGSWDRTVPQGYKVVLLKFENGVPVSDSNFLSYVGPGDTGRDWPYRPVGLAVTKCGGAADCLLVTEDGAGSIIAIIAES